MTVTHRNRLILISCRAAMPAVSELLERDAPHSELVRVTHEFVRTWERLIEYVMVMGWPDTNERNRVQCRREWPRGLPRPGRTRRDASLKKASLDLVVLHEFAAIQLIETALNLRKEVDALHDILEAGIRGQLLQRVDHTLFDRWSCHGRPRLNVSQR